MIKQLQKTKALSVLGRAVLLLSTGSTPADAAAAAALLPSSGNKLIEVNVIKTVPPALLLVNK